LAATPGLSVRSAYIGGILLSTGLVFSATGGDLFSELKSYQDLLIGWDLELLQYF